MLETIVRGEKVKWKTESLALTKDFTLENTNSIEFKSGGKKRRRAPVLSIISVTLCVW